MLIFLIYCSLLQETDGVANIHTVAALDHERESTLDFILVASDGGNPRLSSQAYIHVLLIGTYTIHILYLAVITVGTYSRYLQSVLTVGTYSILYFAVISCYFSITVVRFLQI